MWYGVEDVIEGAKVPVLEIWGVASAAWVGILMAGGYGGSDGCVMDLGEGEGGLWV